VPNNPPPEPLLDDAALERLYARVDALRELTDDECKALGELLVQVRLNGSRQ